MLIDFQKRNITALLAIDFRFIGGERGVLPKCQPNRNDIWPVYHGVVIFDSQFFAQKFLEIFRD